MGHGESNIPNYFISPGYIYLPESQTKISAVLGSSVSITIFDKNLKIGGMNHFLYPEKQREEEPRSIYGDISTKVLINMFMKIGSRKNDLDAQIFGGAFNNQFCKKDIGRDNIETAKRVLLRLGIKVSSSDTGGGKGRKIIFDTRTNEIVIIRVDKLRQTDWFPYE